MFGTWASFVVLFVYMLLDGLRNGSTLSLLAEEAEHRGSWRIS